MDQTIRVWDIDEGKVKILRGHTGAVGSLGILDNRIVSGCWDKTIRVLDIDKAKVKILRGHAGEVYSLTILDGKIISASEDNTIRIWDIDEDRLQSLALKAMLEGDLGEVVIADDSKGNLDIGGIKVAKRAVARGSEDEAKVPAKTISHYTSTTKRYMKRITKDLLMNRNVLLVGERGTGKNSIIYELAHRLNQPIEVLSLNEEVTVRDLTQRMVLIDGRTVWVPSSVVEAIEHDRWLILDEIDRAPAGVLSVLNNLLQFKEFTLPDGRRIKAEDGFRVIALMNPPTSAYAGAELSSELEDRFLIHYIDYLPEQEEVEYLQSLAPNVDTELILRLVRAANDLREDYRQGNLPKPFSTRGLVNVVEHLNQYPEDPVYPELFRVFNLKYLSQDYQQTVDKVFQAYDLMKSNVSISEWQDIAPEDIKEEDFSPEEEDITLLKPGQSPEEGKAYISEEGFSPEEEGIDITEEPIEYIDERTFETTELIATLRGHEGWVYSLTILDNKIVSGTEAGKIKIWDIDEGKVKVLRGHINQVLSLTVLDNRLVSAGTDGTIRIWDITAGKVKVLRGRCD